MVTSHKSQGKTADHVVVAATKLDEKAAYVATSRGRMSCFIHTPDKNHLIAGARHSSVRVGVLDAKELMPSYNKNVIDLVNQEAIVEQQSGKRIVPEKIALPSPIEKLDLPSIPQKLRSMHPIKRQGVKIRSFAKKMLKMVPNPVRLTLSSAMKTKVIEGLSVKQRQNYNVRL